MEPFIAILVHMVLEPICCPSCNSPNVVKNGNSNEGKQRYRCRNAACSRRSFIREYSYRGYLPEVKRQISDMAVNGSAEVCLENHSSGQGSVPAQSTLPGTLPHLPWYPRYGTSS